MAKMLPILSRRLAVFLLALIAIPAVSAQTGITHFSADMKMSSARLSSTGKIYFDGTKVRMEISSQGIRSIMINDSKTKQNIILMPDQHMYLSSDASTGKGRFQTPDWSVYDPKNPCANTTGMTCKQIGMESVNGRLCNKWQFTGGAKSGQIVWIDAKSGIPVKTQAGKDTVIELSNIVEGPQSPSLFQIPAGYQKLNMGSLH